MLKIWLFDIGLIHVCATVGTCIPPFLQTKIVVCMWRLPRCIGQFRAVRKARPTGHSCAETAAATV